MIGRRALGYRLHAMTADELLDFFGDFVWRREPAWLAADSPAHRLGIDLQRATAELGVLYPPEICRRLAKKLDGQRLIWPLFLSGWMPDVSRMLFLGADLAECKRWELEPLLVRHLRHVSSWESARFEGGVWAGLRREGLEVRHEVGEGAGHVADFLVYEEGKRVALEVKSIGIPRQERNHLLLDMTLSKALLEAGQFDVAPHILVTKASADLIVSIRSLSPRQFEADILPDVHSRVAEWFRRNKSAVRPGLTGYIEYVGEIVIEASDDPQVRGSRIDGVPVQGLEHIVSQALSEIQKRAVHQVAAHAAEVRAVVAWISAWHAPVTTAIRCLREQIERRPELYRPLDAIVLLNSHRLAGQCRTEIELLSLPWAPSVIANMRWVNGLTSWQLSV